MKDAKVWLKYVQKRNEKLILCCTYLKKGLTQVRSITTNSHRHFHYNTTLLNYFSIILLWFSKVKKKTIIKFKHFWIYLCKYLLSKSYLSWCWLFWNSKKNPDMKSITKLCVHVYLIFKIDWWSCYLKIMKFITLIFYPNTIKK